MIGKTINGFLQDETCILISFTDSSTLKVTANIRYHDEPILETTEELTIHEQRRLGVVSEMEYDKLQREYERLKKMFEGER